MAVPVIVKSDKFKIVNLTYSPACDNYIVEIVMADDCTTSDLPTIYAESSLAYKVDKDLPKYGFAFDGTWKEL